MKLSISWVILVFLETFSGMFFCFEIALICLGKPVRIKKRLGMVEKFKWLKIKKKLQMKMEVMISMRNTYRGPTLISTQIMRVCLYFRRIICDDELLSSKLMVKAGSLQDLTLGKCPKNDFLDQLESLVINRRNDHPSASPKTV